MKVIIAGSRHMRVEDAHQIGEAVKRSKFKITEVICGTARGADAFGHAWADQNNIPVKEFPADWLKHGRAAGPIRNAKMAKYADGLIVFIWDDSRGAKNLLDQMVKRGKPVYAVWNGKLS